MNPSNGKGSMSTGSSNSPWKTGDMAVSDLFPVGLRVLVVDDDPTCLKILEKMLKTCLYEVTRCNRAEVALSQLRENKKGYDIVISDVHMPDMDGFKLLEHIGLEMDLPVIMMSADDSKDVVFKGVTHGACDYLIKPVRIEALKNIWQHVVRKRRNEWKDFEQSGSMEEGEKQPKQPEDADYSSSANEGNWRNSKKRKDDEEELEEKDDNSTLKKPRVVWSVELHQQFVAAVNQLGIDKAVPKKILELMNVPGLTRENVASHLQKYRLYLRRVSGVSPHQSNLSHSILSPQEATYGSLSSINGFDLHALAASGHLPAESLATLQAAGLGRTTAKTRILGPIVDQRNLVSFENPKVRFGDGQPQHLSTSKQINLLHGIPTTMEPKQLANFNHSVQSLGNINMQVNTQVGQVGQSIPMAAQVSQLQSTGQILCESTGIHTLRLPNSMGLPVISNTIADGVAARNASAENGRGSEFNPVSQTSSMLNFPLNNSVEMPGSGFPLGSTPAISSFASKGAFQEEISSNMKGQGLMSSYDIFGYLHQQKLNSWETQHAGLTFNPSLQPNCDVDKRHSFVAHEAYSSGQTNGQNRNIIRGTKPMFSGGDLSAHLNPQISRHLNSGLSENLVRIKAESNIFPEHVDQEDLMSALLKQGGSGPAENEFDFDGYHVDNIPV